MNAAVDGDAAVLLREAIAITANMLAAAARDDWEAVIEMERDRASLIGHSARLSSEIGVLLQELQALNIELEQLTDAARMAAASAAVAARLNTVAVATYGRTGQG